MKECPRCFRCWDDVAEICDCAERLEASLGGPAVIDGKYRVEQRLGQGGMGVVYRVHHLGLKKTFALKVIATDDEAFRARFQGEAEALGKLRHPNIVDVTDFGLDPREGGLPYLVMEYLEGSTLAHLCRREGRLSLETALPIFESIAGAVDYAHERGILHLDLKPANIFVTPGDSPREAVKILDFGLARFVGNSPANSAAAVPDRSVGDAVDAARCPACGSERSIGSAADAPCPVCLLQWGLSAGSSTAGDEDAATEATGDERLFAGLGAPSRRRCAGTVAYMAPEVLSGQQPTSAADIYSLGILIYEVLAGREPFQGSDSDVIRGHCSEAPPPPAKVNPDLPGEIDEALLPALAKLPARRPGHARDLIGRIRSALFRSRARTWRARESPRRIGIAAAVTVVLLLVSAPVSQLDALQQMENLSIDARFLAGPARAPDSRLILVSLDETSLAADPTPLADKADEFGRHLRRVFEAGARGVAIDFLLPEAWSRSKAFSDLILRYADTLTLAAFSSPAGIVIGPECLNALTAAALGPARASNLFAFVNLDEDRDGVSRRARLGYLDDSGTHRDAWASRAVRSLDESSLVPSSSGVRGRRPEVPARFWIDHSIDWRRFERISWKELVPALERQPDLFRGRLVLVGGDFVGFGGDYHRVPMRAGSAGGISGLVLQALIVNTILSGTPVREIPSATLLLGMGSAVLPLMLAFLLSARWQAPALFVLLLVPLYIAASFLVFLRAHVLLPLLVPLLTVAAAVLLAIVFRIALPGVPEVET
jgi:serine/threonine protein kinase